MDTYKLVKVEEDFWIIEEPGVRSFLFVGDDKAVLIDTGFVKDMAAAVRQVTDLPVMLVNTHADMDHVQGNSGFDVAYMHPGEYPQYRQTMGENAAVKPLQDGEIISVGNRKLQVVLTPGHTPGSISLLDKKNRILVGGDGIQTGEIFMFGPARDLPAYIQTMKGIYEWSDQIDRIYPSHADCPVKPDIIPELIKGAQNILDGKLQWTDGEFHGIMLRVYDLGVAKMLCDAE